MAYIYPFRGYRFNPDKVGKMDSVVTQPYDKISPSMQQNYYEKHERNIVRIILGKEMEKDNEQENKYSRAGRYFRDWLSTNVFKRDETPGIYSYYQTYKAAGKELVRKSFIALGKNEEFGAGSVLPHEKTLAGPKKDRLNLLRATEAQFGLIFMLYSEPERRIIAHMDKVAASTAPDASVVDEYGVLNRLWKITDEKVVAEAQEIMKEKKLFIADGHHRYETNLNYMKEMTEQGYKLEGPESLDRGMMAFVNMDDAGLTILPTHRGIVKTAGAPVSSLPEKLAEYFDVKVVETLGAKPDEAKIGAFTQALAEKGRSTNAFGMLIKGDPKLYMISLKDKSVLEKLRPEGHTAEWMNLDVSVIHLLVIETILGIDKDKLAAGGYIEYIRETPEALEGVLSGKLECSFLLNPTKIDEVKDIALQGETMPQKSTDFYPKLLTGLVLNKVNIVK